MAAATRQVDLRASLDASVYEGLRLATLVIGALMAFFAVADLFTTQPPQFRAQVAFGDLLLSIAFFGVHYLIRAGSIRPSQAHPISAALALGITVDVMHDTLVLADPQQTVYVMLVLLGCGSIFLSTPWLLTVVLGSLAGIGSVAAVTWNGEWVTFALALLAAAVLSVLVHAVRSSTFERLEALRLAESGRKEQLEIREQALESAVRALQESEERYKRLVEGAPDGFLVIRGHEILYANPAAIRLFGAKGPTDLQGVNALTLVHQDDVELVRTRSSLVENGQTVEPAEIRIRRLDGTVVSVEVVGQPITYLGQPADQTVIRDITDRKRAETERQVARERLAEISRLKEMDRVKTQFVNTISHELRTPLTPIKVQLHILKGAKEPAAMKKATEVVERNVTRLSSLVDELLEVARIQAGTLKLAKTYVDIGATVHTVLDSFIDVARQNKLELVQVIDKDVTLLADPRRLQQIMYNLLGNAFKFTEAGGRITVEVRRQGANALVSVRDTGAGLEPAEITRLFEPFSQVHDVMEKTNAGTGLGLYICRGIVEGHGGKIWAESEGRGKGSTFAFTIPIEAPASVAKPST